MKIIDIIILVAYLCGIMFLGSFIGKKNKKGSGEEYLSGGRSMPWYAIGLWEYPKVCVNLQTDVR